MFAKTSRDQIGKLSALVLNGVWSRLPGTLSSPAVLAGAWPKPLLCAKRLGNTGSVFGV